MDCGDFGKAGMAEARDLKVAQIEPLPKLSR